MVKFEDMRGDMPVVYDGAPFIQLGTEVRECHHGPSRNKNRVKRIQEATGPDHSYTGGQKKRRIIQETKKLNCPAKVKFRMLIKFPECKVEGENNKQTRQAVLHRLRSTPFAEIKQQYCVLVKVCGDHNNHLIGEDAGYEQQLDTAVIQNIKDLVWEGVMNPNEIKTRLADVREDITNCPRTNRRFHPTLDDIRNHMYAALKCGRYSANEQTNVQQKIYKWKAANPEDNFFFQPLSSSTNETKNFLFVHQTGFQERLLNKYGNDIVLMDSTFKTTKYNLPLFFLAVLSNVGYMLVASFVTGHETTTEIEDAIRIVMSWNPQWKPSAFMTDLDQREISAIEHCFSDCKVLICSFHREQAWDRWLKKSRNNALADKDEVLRILRRVANSNTIDDLNANIEELKTTDIYLRNTMFQRWIDRYWLANKERWVRCYRSTTMEVYITTTNGVETLNKILKTKYLKGDIGSKSLTALVTVLVEKFGPDMKQKYLKENALSRATHKTYNKDIPLFLREKPKRFLNHCLKRWGLVDENEILNSTDGFRVREYEVNMDTPNCSCPDFRSSGWPCKHMLAVIKFFPAYGWEFMPELYTRMPCFNLCDGEPVISNISDIPITTSIKTTHLREECIELLNSLTSCVYCVEDDVLDTIGPVLRQLNNTVCGSIGQIPTPHKRERRKMTEMPSFIHVSQEDEIGKALSDIWRSQNSQDPVVRVGEYILRRNSFHFLLSTLSDEVMDACLFLTCRDAIHKILHVSSVVMTAIFSGQKELHNYLRRDHFNDYDMVLGAVNEGGHHWTLVVLLLKEKQIVYMNPLGELDLTEQQLLEHWYHFIHRRSLGGLNDISDVGWTVVSPTHAKQADGISCGVYVVKLAERFVSGEPLTFHWNKDELKDVRIQIARHLLAEGENAVNAELVDRLEDDDLMLHDLSHDPMTIEPPQQKRQIDPSSNERMCMTDTQHIYNLRKKQKTTERASFIYPSTRRKQVHCVCKKQDDGSLYWQCENCLEWYHPMCIGKDIEPEYFICSFCEVSNEEVTDEERIEIVTGTGEEFDQIDESFFELNASAVHSFIKEILECDKETSECNDTSHRRHHNFIHDWNAYLRSERRRYMFGSTYLKAEIVELILDYLRKHYLIFLLDPVRPATAARIMFIEGVPVDSKLASILMAEKLLSPHYLTQVLIKDVITFLVSLKTGMPIEAAERMNLATEITKKTF